MDLQTSELVVATRAALAQLSALAVQYSFSVVGAIILLAIGWTAAGLFSRWPNVASAAFTASTQRWHNSFPT